MTRGLLRPAARPHLRPDSFPAVLTGVALGDALGYPNENLTYPQLLSTRLDTTELVVSDDTQLSLVVAQAVRNGTGQRALQEALIRGLVGWLDDPDMRGYGRATISAVMALKTGLPWHRATSLESNGSGAVMRVAACASLPDGVWEPFSAWQAAVTHGGPAAIAAATLATAVTRELASGADGALATALELARGDLPQRAAAWIADHPRAGGDSAAAAELLTVGMRMTRGAVAKAAEVLPAFLRDPWWADPSDPRYGGSGHTAQYALSCALLCADLMPDDPVGALVRASLTGGDSDTIAALTGMFVGAARGDVWPRSLVNRLEVRYRNEILSLGGIVRPRP